MHLYYSFLLRLWQDDESSPWRIQLEDPHTGERRGFATLAQAVEFLTRQMEAQHEKPIHDSGRGSHTIA